MTGTVVSYKEAYETLLETISNEKNHARDVLKIQSSQFKLLKDLRMLSGITQTEFVDPFVAEQIKTVSKNALMAIAIQYEQHLKLKRKLMMTLCNSLWRLTRNVTAEQLEDSMYCEESMIQDTDSLRCHLIHFKSRILRDPFGDLNHVYLALTSMKQLLHKLAEKMRVCPPYYKYADELEDLNGIVDITVDMQASESILSTGIREIRLAS